jgi:hypothetical protein
MANMKYLKESREWQATTEVEQFCQFCWSRLKWSTKPVIKINDELWKFLYWEHGTENSTFINSDSKLYIFNPRNIYYSDNRNIIMRMEEEIIEEEV